MSIDEIKIIERKGNEAVQRLRKAKFEKGFPFMINCTDLPGNQCYLEYPDGRITLVCLESKYATDFTFIRELSNPEKEGLRKRFNLS